jgi:hypothetical protein
MKKKDTLNNFYGTDDYNRKSGGKVFSNGKRFVVMRVVFRAFGVYFTTDNAPVVQPVFFVLLITVSERKMLYEKSYRGPCSLHGFYFSRGCCDAAEKLLVELYD